MLRIKLWYLLYDFSNITQIQSHKSDVVANAWHQEFAKLRQKNPKFTCEL